jgi:hypothetical protein
MSNSQRRKGAAGEREFLGLMRDYLGDQTIRRNLNQSRDGGADGAGTSLELARVAVEVKRTETFKPRMAMAQAMDAAREFNGVPAVAWRRNSGQWQVWVQLTPTEFADFVRNRM